MRGTEHGVIQNSDVSGEVFLDITQPTNSDADDLIVGDDRRYRR